MNNKEMQLEELQVLQSMFPSENEFCYDKDAEGRLMNGNSTGAVRMTLYLPKEIRLELVFNENYPTQEALQVQMVIPRGLEYLNKEDISRKLQLKALELIGEMAAWSVIELAKELVEEPCIPIKKMVAVIPKLVQKQRILGRRAIYFHHIIANNKRKVVVEWANHFQLGGYSKIGWPGVVIVEGDEEDCRAYVANLQHLRWKQMVVRGEQTEIVSINSCLQEMRKLPMPFQELGQDGMSTLAQNCEAAGVQDLFLATMKIYNRN